MNKITSIKIKYNDETFSDQIPISVLAENINWDDTHSIIDAIGAVDINTTGSLQDQINNKVNTTDLSNYVNSQLAGDIADWLNANVNPVGSAVVVDKTFSIEGAAADAKAVIDNFSTKTQVNQIIAATIGQIKWQIPQGAYGKPKNFSDGSITISDNKIMITGTISSGIVRCMVYGSKPFYTTESPTYQKYPNIYYNPITAFTPGNRIKVQIKLLDGEYTLNGTDPLFLDFRNIERGSTSWFLADEEERVITFQPQMISFGLRAGTYTNAIFEFTVIDVDNNNNYKAAQTLQDEINKIVELKSASNYWAIGGFNAAMDGVNNNITNRARIPAAQMPNIPYGEKIALYVPEEYLAKMAVYDLPRLDSVNEIIIPNFTNGTILIDNIYQYQYFEILLKHSEDENQVFTEDQILQLQNKIFFKIYNPVNKILNDVLTTSIDYGEDFSEGIVRWATGENSDDAVNNTWYHTDFIDISLYKDILYKKIQTATSALTVSSGMAFYDENKVYISGFATQGSSVSTRYKNSLTKVATPNNAYYARFTVLNYQTYGNFELYGILKNIPKNLNNLDNKIEKLKEQYIQHDIACISYSSGGWNYETGKTFSNNARIRSTGITLITAHKGDYIEFNQPYMGVVLVQSGATAVQPYWTNGEYVSGKVFIPDDCVGKFLFVSIKKNDDSNIEDDVSIIKNYVKFYHRCYNEKLDRCTEYEHFTVFVNGQLPNNTITTKTVADGVTRKKSTCVITLPENYSPIGKPCPVIMMCHGLHGFVSYNNWYGTSNESSTFLQLIEAYTSHGYAVFDTDQINNTVGGASFDMGCPQHMARYMATWEYVKTYYNVQDRIFIQGYSQGNFPMMNFLRRYPGMIKAALSTGTRASIKAVFDQDPLYAEEIAIKFGFEDQTGATYEPDKVIGEDTYANIIWREDESPYLPYQIPPLKVVMSQADTTDYQPTYDTILALKNGGNRIEWRILETASHGAVCAGSGFTDEFVMWFDRFKGSDI